MNSHNGNSHTELTWEEKTSAVEFLKCTLCDEKFMNELDKMKHVERKHRETLCGKRKRQSPRLEDLKNNSDSDNYEPENEAKEKEIFFFKKERKKYSNKDHIKE